MPATTDQFRRASSRCLHALRLLSKYAKAHPEYADSILRCVQEGILSNLAPDSGSDADSDYSSDCDSDLSSSYLVDSTESYCSTDYRGVDTEDWDGDSDYIKPSLRRNNTVNPSSPRRFRHPKYTGPYHLSDSEEGSARLASPASSKTSEDVDPFKLPSHAEQSRGPNGYPGNYYHAGYNPEPYRWGSVAHYHAPNDLASLFNPSPSTDFPTTLHPASPWYPRDYGYQHFPNKFGASVNPPYGGQQENYPLPDVRTHPHSVWVYGFGDAADDKSISTRPRPPRKHRWSRLLSKSDKRPDLSLRGGVAGPRELELAPRDEMRHRLLNIPFDSDTAAHRLILFKTPVSVVEKNRSIQQLISAHLKPKELEDSGFIYCFRSPWPKADGDDHSALMLRTTTRKNVPQAVQMTARRCKYGDRTPEVLFVVPVSHGLQRYGGLVYRTLGGERRREERCLGCHRTHCEWFAVSQATARDVAGLWARFSDQQPYRPEGNLNPEWARRLERVRVEDEGCWREFVRGPTMRESGITSNASFYSYR